MSEETKNHEDGQEKAKIAFTPMKVKPMWADLKLRMLHTTVFLFVGSVEEMISTGEEELIKDEFGMTKEYISAFGRRLCEIVANGSGRSFQGQCYKIDCGEFGTDFLIRMESFSPGNVTDIAVLSHECCHTAFNIMRHLGIVEDERSPREFYCYLQEFIFQSFLKKIHQGKMVDATGEVIDKC